MDFRLIEFANRLGITNEISKDDGTNTEPVEVCFYLANYDYERAEELMNKDCEIIYKWLLLNLKKYQKEQKEMRIREFESQLEQGE